MVSIANLANINNTSKPVFENKAKDKQVSVPFSGSNSNAKYSAENIRAYAPSFSASLQTPEEQKKYDKVAKKLDRETRGILNTLLKTGVLLDSNSNNKSTVLDNLYRIATEPKMEGLNKSNILKDTVKIIADPTTITQNIGDVPEKKEKEFIARDPQKYNHESLNAHSSCCVAASIEYTLAGKQPAEYARMAADLTSPEGKTTKKIKLSTISPNTVDALWLLNEFKLNYKMLNWDDVEITLTPDKNAIEREKIQTTDRDPDETSPLEIAFMSTLMNTGSQNTYDSLTDTRSGIYNPDNKGLVDIEKNLVEEIVEDQPKVSVTYQILDETGKITGYECDAKTVQKHIMDALKLNNNVIIGYADTLDNENRFVNGHEITIVGAEQSPDGKVTFICNDTDDYKSELKKWPAEELIPLIHHAGLPKEVLKDDVEFVDSWREVLDMYNQSKNAPPVSPEATATTVTQQPAV